MSTLIISSFNLMTSTKIKRVEGAVDHATGAAAMDTATGMMRVCFQCLMLWKQFKAIFAAVADIKRAKVHLYGYGSAA